jgi:protein-disulfide isomerase
MLVCGQAADQVIGGIWHASMTCPHCADFHLNTFPELKKRYIDTGKLRFIFREFAQDPLAIAASTLARCAGKANYFRTIETLFAKQREWIVQEPLPKLLGIVSQFGFTRESFDACLANQQIIAGIEASRARAAAKFNVNATPTYKS